LIDSHVKTLQNNIVEKYNWYKDITIEKNLFTPVNSFSNKLPFESAEFIRNAWNLIMKNNRLSDRLSLYVHIPFCYKTRCHYCMYYALIKHDTNLIDLYVQYLIDNITYFEPVFAKSTFESLYIGGGTPSLLNEDQLSKLLTKINDFRFHPSSEKTYEQSILTTSKEKIELLKNFGISRLSFGMQSIEPNVLKKVNRAYADEQKIREIIGYAKKTGFGEINIDLMIGLPEETSQGLRDGIQVAYEAGADCITVYIFRHLKHHMDQLDSARKKTIVNYNKEHVPEMLKVAREKVAEIGWVDTVEDDNTEYQYFTSEEHLREYSLSGYRTQPDSEYGNNTVGFGHSSFSYAQDFFRYECREKKYAFNPKSKSYVFDMVYKNDRQRIYTIEKLNRDRYVDLNQFLDLFGEKFEDVFNQEINEILYLERCKIDKKQFRLTSSDRIEHAALSKFFWNQEYLKQLI